MSTSGGTGVFYKNFAKALEQKGYQVVVFGTAKNPVDFYDNGIRVKFVQDYFKKFRLLELLRSITGKLPFFQKKHLQYYLDEKKYIVSELMSFLQNQNISPDIIETHDWEGMALYLDETNIPYVVRCHGSWTVLEQVFGYKKVSIGKKYCEKLAFQKIKNSIVISEFSRTINAKFFGLTNAKLIYNGIDEGFFQPNETELIPQSIFYLGNVSKEKGADTALKAFAELKKVMPEASLHFIGKSNGYQNNLDLFLPQEFHASVVFHGHRNSRELVQLISQAELVFFPSKGENFSLSLLETMALEKAVICSDIPAFTEIIKNANNGMIAADEAEFSDIAIALLKDTLLRKQLEQNARATIVNHFTQDKMIRETIMYYQQVYEKF